MTDIDRKRELIQRAIHLEYKHILFKTTIKTMERAHLNIAARQVDCTMCPYSTICAEYPLIIDYLQDNVAEVWNADIICSK